MRVYGLDACHLSCVHIASGAADGSVPLVVAIRGASNLKKTYDGNVKAVKSIDLDLSKSRETLLLRRLAWHERDLTPQIGLRKLGFVNCAS